MWNRLKESLPLPRVREVPAAGRGASVLSTVLLHFRPVQLSARTLRYTHTFGLGGSALVLFLVLTVTGTLLMFAYEPAPDAAHASLVRLESQTLFGGLVRSAHHWSAQLLVVIVGLHLLRVLFTGGFHGPRRFNWLIGVVLLLAVAVAGLTGYLLPWDQLAYWATTIVTGMLGTVPLVGGWLQGVIRGGPEVGPATLVIFLTLHTTVVPAALIVLMAWHFWRVRKAGGVVVPRGADETPVPRPDRVRTLPALLVREAALGLALVAVVLVLAVLVPADLGPEANPGMSPDPAKAPWYFAGFQELLLHLDPLFAVAILPLLGFVGLALLPYLPHDPETAGVFLVSPRGRRLVALGAALGFAVSTLVVVGDAFWLPAVTPGASLVWRGLVPGAGLVGGLALFFGGMRRSGAGRSEAVQACAVAVLAAFAVLTVTGAWLRCSGMALVWPGGTP